MVWGELINQWKIPEYEEGNMSLFCVDIAVNSIWVVFLGVGFEIGW